MVSGRLNVVKGLKRISQVVDFGRNPHMIGLYAISVKIYWARDHSMQCRQTMSHTLLRVAPSLAMTPLSVSES